MESEDGVRILTTARAHAGTRPAVTLPQRSAVESETTWICATLSTTKMHMSGLKTDARSETTLSMNAAMKWVMTIMVPSTINLTDTIPRKEDTMMMGSNLSPMT
jgi:hypothetical protein